MRVIKTLEVNQTPLAVTITRVIPIYCVWMVLCSSRGPLGGPLMDRLIGPLRGSLIGTLIDR